MSVEIPKVSVVFGSVEPPQGDVLELRVHLGCTKEVSSFECLLQNFDKKYTVTNPISVGDSASVSIGRGTGPGNCPLILTGRVEEVEPESTPVENYIRVRGRCLGEKIFRRVVTETYENQKGEAIVKDLLDNYAGLSHVRDSTELVENTDTTYTLLEYENTPVFDILKYIAESADKAGVIGFDFRVEYDGQFAFFPRNSKTSPISLSEVIEQSRYSKDIHRIRNKIRVYGAAEKPYPLDVDGQPWSDSLTEDLTKPDNYLDHVDGQWDVVTGNTTLYIETTEVHTGSSSVKVTCTAYMYYMGIKFTFDSDKYVNCNKYPKLCFTLQEDSSHNKKVTIQLEDKDGNICRQILDVGDYNEWQSYQLGVGKLNQESWTMSVFNSGPFDWENLKKVRFDFHQNSSSYGSAYVDRMHFGGRRWEDTEEDSSSQTNYGLRELIEVDEELHSDHECELRAKALLDHLSQPAEFLTLRTTCLDYEDDRLLPGDKIHVTLPNENIDSDFRIIAVEYQVTARDQTLEITLELGKEKPLLADYLYGLRSTTITVEKLMRTKAGLTCIAGGGGGGGGQADEKVKVSSDDTTADFLLQKLLAGTGITLSENSPGGDEKVRIDAHRKWSWADEWSWVRSIHIPYSKDNWVSRGVVLSPTPGEWDSAMVAQPCVLRIGTTYRLYYTGRSGLWETTARIGLATSSDGLNFTKYGTDGKIVNPPTGYNAVCAPSVLYDVYETDPAKKYKMTCGGHDGVSWKPLLWYSSDGITWNFQNEITGLGNFKDPTILFRIGNAYFLFHRDATTNEIRLDITRNFTTFYDAGILFTKGGAGEWDENGYGYLGVFWNLGVWYLLMQGIDGSNVKRIGMATSSDGFSWNKYPMNPIQDIASGTWYSNMVAQPTVLMVEEMFWLFVMGYDGSSYRIGRFDIA